MLRIGILKLYMFTVVRVAVAAKIPVVPAATVVVVALAVAL